MKPVLAAFILFAAPAAAVAQAPSEGPAPADAYLQRDREPDHRGCGPSADGRRPTSDGQVHGDVVAGVGTDNYREAGVRFCAPLGANGEASVAITRVRGGNRRPPPPSGHPPVPDDR